MKYFLSLCLLITAGCSSLSKEECQSTNWINLGKSDAMKGKTSPQHTSYQKDCSEHGFTIDEKKYLTGYDQGLELYCNYQNGYNLGKRGYGSHLYCEKTSGEFKKGLKVGRAEFKLIEKKKERKEALKEHLMAVNGGVNCPEDNLCKKTAVCDYNNRCVDTGKYCTFLTDCESTTNCMSASGYTEYNELATVKFCPSH
jgi:hypothetical protein